MKKTAIALTTVAALLAASTANAQTGAQTVAADPKAGRELAVRLCASCHDVSAGSPSTLKVDVPSFESIAARPNTTAEHLAGRIIVPHPAMPATQLTVAEIRNVIAYIMALKPADR